MNCVSEVTPATYTIPFRYDLSHAEMGEIVRWCWDNVGQKPSWYRMLIGSFNVRTPANVFYFQRQEDAILCKLTFAKYL